ncbi:tryptophan--tRNA ligase [Cellulomonas shaoxiangyii]|uniref:Tryptophan--tRNA ligase n=1 Tax=Cellulomonas shaoxiangyii TaxID=2566013 RepID=A0A4P7SJS7_9CELL|nr:tryptophan--tRNA ligase [Cellulomonas shaoxiangyii]QCB94380.1 tryptophan--tRNA ligase [Cellulomonas shaoxiangyii]TGY84750.1 tryptophan--tRNA ligase [Cellulomonas shaoxiangyii]
MSRPTTSAAVSSPGGAASTAARPPASALPTRSVLAAQRRSAELELELAREPHRFRVLTGDRPTGPLHLGHYLGTLTNRVRLQRAGVEMFLVVADYQVITDRDVAGDVRGNVRELLLDYLATGVAARGDGGAGEGSATIFTHSAVPALNQLLLPFLSLVSVAELQRNPTVKAEAAAAKASGGRSMSGLLLTYPVHQAADILFCAANLVPVGQDQLPHLETTRLVARRFNDRYGSGERLLSEPEALLSPAPLLLGTDGAKMSKSAGNAVALRADEDETARLIRSARTDAGRHITYDPVRRPEVASLLLTAALCAGTTPEALAGDIGAGGGAVLKRTVTEAVNEHLRPLRERRRELEGADDLLRGVLAAGNQHANAVAARTLQRVQEAMGMTY